MVVQTAFQTKMMPPVTRCIKVPTVVHIYSESVNSRLPIQVEMEFSSQNPATIHQHSKFQNTKMTWSVIERPRDELIPVLPYPVPLPVLGPGNQIEVPAPDFGKAAPVRT